MNDPPLRTILPVPREGAGGDSRPTVGILYPGELGSTLGRLLTRAGLTVVSTVKGRSERTRRLAEAAGLALVSEPGEVAARADVVLSAVSPAAALPVARHYLLGRAGARRRQLYVDLNSTSPETACGLERVLRPAGLDFVDGALHGLASGLPERGTLYLSGAAAQAAAAVLGRALPVRVVGDRAGQASAFKMLISGLAKGVVALFVEMSLAARRAGLLDDFLACSRRAYPGILELAERLLPTYPRHAARRAEEAREVEETLRALGLRALLAAGTRELTEELARAARGGWAGGEAEGPASVPQLIEALAARGALETSAGEEATKPRPPAPTA